MATLIDQDFMARLRALNDKFAASIPATLARLREHRAAFVADAPQQEAVTALHETLHTIAGSAATFGFRSYGQQARMLEQQLRGLMAAGPVPAGDWEAWLAALDAFVAWAEIDPKAESSASGIQ